MLYCLIKHTPAYFTIVLWNPAQILKIAYKINEEKFENDVPLKIQCKIIFFLKALDDMLKLQIEIFFCKEKKTRYYETPV